MWSIFTVSFTANYFSNNKKNIKKIINSLIAISKTHVAFSEGWCNFTKLSGKLFLSMYSTKLANIVCKYVSILSRSVFRNTSTIKNVFCFLGFLSLTNLSTNDICQEQYFPVEEYLITKTLGWFQNFRSMPNIGMRHLIYQLGSTKGIADFEGFICTNLSINLWRFA